MKKRRGEDGPFYGKGPHDGFHVLKDAWKQRTFLAAQCLELARDLRRAIDTTFKEAPTRTREQLRLDLDHRSRLPPEQMGISKKHPGRERPSEERLLERAIYDRFRLGGGSPVCDLWSGLVTFQYALFDNRGRDDWGAVDLLGSVMGRPLVVELKARNNVEPPLRAILEAASYAIALRRNWDTFSPLFADHLRRFGETADTLRDGAIPLLVLAESTYWENWCTTGKIGARRPPETWTNLRLLVATLATHGYPVVFGSVTARRSPGRKVFDEASIGVTRVDFV